jgi:hypothetical protein
MTDPTGNADESRESSGAPPGVPLWVKVFATVVLAVALVLVVIMLVAGGEHGPGLHTGAVNRSGIFACLPLGGPGRA